MQAEEITLQNLEAEHYEASAIAEQLKFETSSLGRRSCI
jgi:hypothetical protein